MKKSKLMAALIALLMSASILPMQAWAEEENTSEEAAPAEEVIEAVEPAPVEEIVEVAEPADAEVEIALTAEPEAAEVTEQTEVSEPAVPAEENVTAETETEESEEPAAEPFTCKIGVTPLNREAIREGDEVVLMATVTDASMAYTLRWESRAITAAPDDPWHLEGTDESIAFTATEATAAREYRVSAVSEDGTVQISKTWRFALAEPEMTAESVEEPAEEPAESTEEAVEEPAEVTEEIIEEIIPEEENLEIDDYETPLGLGNLLTSNDVIEVKDLGENATFLTEILDEMNEDRKIGIYIVSNEQIYFEDEVQLVAVLTGYENCVFKVHWQESADNIQWTDIAEENDLTYAFTVTEDNYTHYWRIVVDIIAVDVPADYLG